MNLRLRILRRRAARTRHSPIDDASPGANGPVDGTDLPGNDADDDAAVDALPGELAAGRGEGHAGAPEHARADGHAQPPRAIDPMGHRGHDGAAAPGGHDGLVGDLGDGLSAFTADVHLASGSNAIDPLADIGAAYVPPAAAPAQRPERESSIVLAASHLGFAAPAKSDAKSLFKPERDRAARQAANSLMELRPITARGRPDAQGTRAPQPPQGGASDAAAAASRASDAQSGPLATLAALAFQPPRRAGATLPSGDPAAHATVAPGPSAAAGTAPIAELPRDPSPQHGAADATRTAGGAGGGAAGNFPVGVHLEEAPGGAPPAVYPLVTVGTGRDAPRIGEIMVAMGHLGLDRVQKVLQVQSLQVGKRFGVIAVELGFVDESDVQSALGRQFNLPALAVENHACSRELLAAYEPRHATVATLREVRERILQGWIDRGNPLTVAEPGTDAARKRTDVRGAVAHYLAEIRDRISGSSAPRGVSMAARGRAVSIVSPGRGDGRSFVAANLAVLFAQLGRRTLLVDADLRNPRQHMVFGLDDRIGLSTVLAGRSGSESVHRIDGFENLCVLPGGPVPPNPEDLLSRGEFASLLQQAEADFDVVLVDTAAWAAGMDARLAGARTRAAALVLRAGQSGLRPAQELVQAMRQADVSVLGIVFNR